MEEYYKKEKEEQDKANKQLKNSTEIHKPNIGPSNVYNASMPVKK